MGIVFESFRQADETIGRRFGGTGLGLSIVKQLAEVMGGSVRAESEVGRGSVFTVEIPVAESNEAVRSSRLSAGERHLVVGASEAFVDTASAAIAQCGGSPVAIRDFGAFAAAAKLALGNATRPTIVAMPSSLGMSRVGFVQSVREALPTMTPIFIMLEPEAPSGADTGPDRFEFFSMVPLADCGRALPALLYAADLIALGVSARRESGSPAPAPASAVKRVCRVLVAEDNLVNRRLIGRILESAGHQATLVANGEEALDELERQRFDVVLMDINMPELNGIEATKLYRFGHIGDAHLPIVALTADATPEMRARCRDAGMDDVLLKPVEVDELVRVIVQVSAAAPVPSAGEADAPTATAATSARDAFSGKVVAHRQPAQLPVIDPSSIEALRKLDDSGGFFESLVEDFLVESEQMVCSIADAIARADVEDVRSRTHALRSSAAHFGARRLHMLCVALGKLSRGQLAEAGAERGAELRREYRLAAEQLRREAESGLRKRAN